MQSSANQLKVGSLLSYVQMFIGAIISIAYTPIMLRLLGQSEYGLYNTVVSTISMLSLLSLGFNSGYIRYYAKYKQSGDIESIWKLNGLFLIVFSIIGVVGLTCGLFLSFHLNIIFSSGLTIAEYKVARRLMILLSVNLAISFPMSVFENIISANEQFIILKIISILKTVVSPLATLPLLLMGYHSIAMVVVTLIVSVITDAIYVFFVIRRLHNKFLFQQFEQGLFMDLFFYTILISINMIVDQINWNVDKILLGRFRGTDAVAVYSVGYTLFHYYMMISTSISFVFTPRIHRLVQQTKDDLQMQRMRVSELFIKVGRIQFLLLGLVASGFVFFGSKFITQYWAGSVYTESYYVALLLMLPATIAFIQNTGIEIQRALNKHWFRSVAYTVMATVNILVSIVLCQKYGAVGSAVGTAASLILANGIVMNTYYHRQCNLDVICFWKNILSMFPGMLPPICCGILMKQYAVLTDWWGFALEIMAYTAIYCTSMWKLAMSDIEKGLFLKMVQRMVTLRFDQSK